MLVAVDAGVFALEGIVDALGIEVDIAVGVVREAGMLVLLTVGQQGDVHALARQFAESEAAHAFQDQGERLVAAGDKAGVMVVGAVRIPGIAYLFQVVDEQFGRRKEGTGRAAYRSRRSRDSRRSCTHPESCCNRTRADDRARVSRGAPALPSSLRSWPQSRNSMA